jgi:DNA-binding NarL/FixJ family response regulator
MIRDILQTKEIDVLILDLELEGLSSIFEVKSILKIFQRQKLLYSVVFQNRFMRQMLLKQGQDLFTKRKTRNQVYQLLK